MTTRPYVNWRWRCRNHEKAYAACSEVHHEAIDLGLAEWRADQLADEEADRWMEAQQQEDTACPS